MGNIGSGEKFYQYVIRGIKWTVKDTNRRGGTLFIKIDTSVAHRGLPTGGAFTRLYSSQPYF